MRHATLNNTLLMRTFLSLYLPLFTAAWFPGAVYGAEPSDAASIAADVEAAPAVAPEKPKLTPEQKERQRKAYVGLAAVAGIVIVGVSLGALTILWAGRLRRQLRRTEPACSAKGGEFWFLNPPKPTVSESSLPESHLPSHTPPPTEPF